MGVLKGFRELYGKEFNIYVQNCGKMYWNNRYKFSCMESGKPTDMLLYLANCEGEYELPDGTVIYAPRKSFVYAPKGIKYKFRCTEAQEDVYSNILINFVLTDKDGEDIKIYDGIKVMTDLPVQKLEKLFLDTAAVSGQNVRFPCGLIACTCSVLSELCSHYNQKKKLSKKYQIISKGILYLEENEDLEMSVSDIAKMCNVSEIYFRKLFREYSGMTPVQFKINKKIEKAKQYLAFEGKTVRETAEALGFTDVAYFCRVFKQKTGITPGEVMEK